MTASIENYNLSEDRGMTYINGYSALKENGFIKYKVDLIFHH